MPRKKEQLSIIDNGLNIEGTLQFKGKIIVAGTLQGDIYGEHVLTVKGSYVSANVKVDEISISGTIEGNIIAYNRLKIASTGHVTGTLFCNTLVIEAGGVLNGKVKRLTPSVVSSLEPKRANSTPSSSSQL